MSDVGLAKGAAMKATDNELSTAKADERADAERENEELQEYRNFVARVAEAADGTTILNRSPKHASVIIEYLFRKSRHEMKILTGELHSGVYGHSSVIDAATSFLRDNPSARISIKSEKEIAQDRHPLLVAIDRAGFKDRISVETLSTDQARSPFHFAVGDGIHFRFEQSPPSYEALAQFGGEKFGSRLVKVFSALKS